jgi:2-C-methyl-D-erythritol 4-phosphate cytidylyltransferase/2-C-methyl-D-erythritol 2,4-cyclodiphosphate synthase
MNVAVALVVAAGRGTRAGGDVPKQYRSLGGKPVLRRTIEAYLGHPQISAVRVVIHAEDMAIYSAATASLDLLAPVFGGAARQDSVRLGLQSLRDLNPELILVHDAARPFVSSGVIARVVAALATAPAAIPALPIIDTLKRGEINADGRLSVGGTVQRTGLWRAQTPQGFRYRPLLAAHERAAGCNLTDDAAVAEAAGLEVAIVEGDEDNVKLTSADDIRRAERLVASDEVRIGSGFDVHRFATDGDVVTLCGVSIAHDRGLEGHSDADVALHALTDALLGAIGAGDIGSHFPPSNPRWRGSASEIFVRHAVGLIAAAGGTIVNVDVTLICERPKIEPHRPTMVARVAEMLAIDPNRISIKATTTEGLGFTGRREGIAAQAVAAVRLPGKL